MLRPDLDEIVHIGAKGDLAPFAFALHSHLDGEEGRILDRDPDPLDGRDEHVALGILAQNRRKQLHEGGPVDRRSHVMPRAVGGDAHVDFAAIGRVPALDRRRPFARGIGAERLGKACQGASGSEGRGIGHDASVNRKLNFEDRRTAVDGYFLEHRVPSRLVHSHRSDAAAHRPLLIDTDRRQTSYSGLLGMRGRMTS